VGRRVGDNATVGQTVLFFVEETVGGILFGLLRIRRRTNANVVKILTWSGLRGGIAVALALSFPLGPERGTILVATYMVVVFSVAVQGLSIEKRMRRWEKSV